MEFPVDIVCSFLSKRQLEAVLHGKGLYMSALLMLMFLNVSVLVLLFLHCTSMLFLIILPITMLMMRLFTESLIQLLNLNIKQKKLQTELESRFHLTLQFLSNNSVQNVSSMLKQVCDLYFKISQVVTCSSKLFISFSIKFCQQLQFTIIALTLHLPVFLKIFYRSLFYIIIS